MSHQKSRNDSSLRVMTRDLGTALFDTRLSSFLPDSGAEEEREEVGDEERVDGLLRVGRTLPVVVETRLDCVEGPAGVVGAQLARRRRFSTSDNVGKLPLPESRMSNFITVCFLGANQITLWGVRPFVMFSFLFFWKFWLPIGLQSSCSICQRPVEHVNNVLQNITTERTPQSVLLANILWRNVGP